MAKKRLKIMEEMIQLALDDKIVTLAQALINHGPLPQKASLDAFHIAISTVHQMDYLLSWNFRHIVNAEMRLPIMQVCERNGYTSPVICTPEELLGG